MILEINKERLIIGRLVIRTKKSIKRRVNEFKLAKYAMICAGKQSDVSPLQEYIVNFLENSGKVKKGLFLVYYINPTIKELKKYL